MFLIDRDSPLNTIILGKILNKFQTLELPKFQRLFDYYRGKQDILLKVATDVGKPCNKVVCNYCQPIVNNYLGYITGKPILYTSDEDLEKVYEVLNYNDVHCEDSELLKSALIYGRAFEICYIDEEKKQRFKTLDTRECIPIYDNTLNNDLLYVVRFYVEDLLEDITNQKYIVEVYGPNTIKKYKSSIGFASFEFISEEPHYYGQCPITVFKLNSEEQSIFEQVMSLQDSYNNILSDEIDDFDAFCDAYLVLKGCIAEEEDLTKMKQNRVLLLDSDADASYLTKSVADTQVQNLLDKVNDHIHSIANSPDFTDEKFSASTGIALRLKLIGLENTAANIEQNMRKALQRRIELICAILNLVDDEMIWRDINIVFTRNLPVETENIASMVNMLRGLVSTETLLGQLPFIADPIEESKRVEEEKQRNMDLYSFGAEEETTFEDFGTNT